MKNIIALAFTSLSAQQAVAAPHTTTIDCKASTVQASANYTGKIHNTGTEVRLRITNGGGEFATILRALFVV